MISWRKVIAGLLSAVSLLKGELDILNSQIIQTGSTSAAFIAALLLVGRPLIAQSMGSPFSLTPIYAADEPPVPAGGESSEDELAKKTLNPVADLISVPFQYNMDFNIGPKDARRQTLNIQPVIPITLSPDWNLITRTIIPVVSLDRVAPGADSKDGIGDITQSFFFSPKKPMDGWIVGVGPVFLWPTGTDGLSSRKWGAGPTAVLLRQENGWTYGILANHIWSYAGSDSTPNVNATFLQPFLSYTFKTHTSITIQTESTYDWDAHQWTVPVNLLASQILKIGKLPISLQAGPRFYVEGPSGGPDWGFRVTLTFLFPK